MNEPFSFRRRRSKTNWSGIVVQIESGAEAKESSRSAKERSEGERCARQTTQFGSSPFCAQKRSATLPVPAEREDGPLCEERRRGEEQAGKQASSLCDFGVTLG